MREGEKMIELTTLRVEKPVVEWLNTLKGILEYALGEKLTLNEALIHILAEVDALYANRQGSIKYKDNERIDFIEKRVNQFWGANSKEKPTFEIVNQKEYFLKDFLRNIKKIKR